MARLDGRTFASGGWARAGLLAAALGLGPACTGQIDEGAGPGEGGDLRPPPTSGDRGGGNAPASGPPGGSPDGPPGTSAPDAPAGATDRPAACGATTFDRTPLRRLTRTQYANTVRDLFGAALGAAPLATALEAAGRFPVDDRVGPFAGNASTSISDAHARLYLEAAELLADAVTRPEALRTLLACTPAAGAEATCAGQFIRSFGRRAFRRPPAADLVAGLEKVYAAGAQQGGFASGIRLVVQAALASPDFLYHLELPPSAATPAPLDPFELASRLSYFLWDSMPDEALLTAAAGGQLASAEAIRRQAERLLGDARARDAVTRFAVEWLGLDGVESLTRDPVAYPAFVPALPAAMKAETIAFVDQVLRRGDGLLATLLTSSQSYLPDPLFKVYGVSKPLFYAATSPFQLPKEQRAGVLTHPSVLATTAHSDHTSPVKRGMFLLTNVLCHEIPLPEGLEIPPLPDPDPTKTTRERFVQHTAQPACAACHKIIDPMGFALERYDSVGAYRPTEGGKPIDETGTIAVADAQLDGPVAGAVQLSAKLAASEKVRACLAKQVHRFALGRLEGAADACTIAKIAEPFARSGYNLRELLLAMATSDAFRTHPAAGR